MIYIVIYMIIVNLITCILYGMDKLKAMVGGRRTPEKILLGFSLAGGSFGAFAGMQIFRHKTRHIKFQICVPLFMVIHIVFLVFLYVTFYV